MIKSDLRKRNNVNTMEDITCKYNETIKLQFAMLTFSVSILTLYISIDTIRR